MKLIAIIVLYKDEIACGSWNLYSFSFFTRGKVKEWTVFFAKTIIKNTRTVGQRQTVKHEEYCVHSYRRGKSLGCIAVTDEEYPGRVAFNLMNIVLDEFEGKYEDVLLKQGDLERCSLPNLDGYLQDYQEPQKADKLTRLQDEVDETKIILHGTIESVLERGQLLNEMIEKSEDLSQSSKMFANTASGRCCTIS